MSQQVARSVAAFVSGLLLAALAVDRPGRRGAEEPRPTRGQDTVHGDVHGHAQVPQVHRSRSAGRRASGRGPRQAAVATPSARPPAPVVRFLVATFVAGAAGHRRRRHPLPEAWAAMPRRSVRRSSSWPCSSWSRRDAAPRRAAPRRRRQRHAVRRLRVRTAAAGRLVARRRGAGARHAARRHPRRGCRWWKSAFNCGQYALSVAAAGLLLEHWSGTPSLDDDRSGAGAVALAACATFFVVNHVLDRRAASPCATGGRAALAAGWTCPFQPSVNGAVVAMAPLVVAVANDSLWLVALLLVPVVAVHRGARSALDQRAHVPARPAHRAAQPRRLPRAAAEQLAGGVRTDAHVAVLVLSLDHFSDVNHTLGHSGRRRPAAPGGRPAARRPSRRARSLARVDAGGFLVARPRARLARRRPAPAPRRCCSSSARRTRSRESEFALRASVGVTVAPLHGTDPDRLVQHAEVARDVARRSHTGARGLQRRAQRLHRPPAGRARRARPGAATPGDAGALPAAGRPAHRRRDRLRGAAALAAPDARGRARRTSSCRSPSTPG